MPRWARAVGIFALLLLGIFAGFTIVVAGLAVLGTVVIRIGLDNFFGVLVVFGAMYILAKIAWEIAE